MEKKNLNNQDIEREVEKTLNSINAIKRVQTDGLLFEHLQKRLIEPKKPTAIRKTLQPVWQAAAVGIILLINGFVLSQSGYFTTEDSTPITAIDEFANEYLIADSDVEELDYYNLNE